MRAAVILLSLAASAFGYQVTIPGQNYNWTNNGPQTLSWVRVSTDATNFTAILVNQDKSILTAPEALAALVDGTLGSINVNPPSGGWPLGSGFQVNLVESAQNTDTIYAQSTQFSITSGNSSASSSSTATGVIQGSGVAGPLVTVTASPIATDTSSASSTPTTTSNGALPVLDAHMGFMGIAALLGALLL
jgi:hypothetical protein